MSVFAEVQLSDLALDVAAGLSMNGQKRLSSRYFYDDLGSALFEAITLLPEYGLTRADERVLRRCASELRAETGAVRLVAELGSGSGTKTEHVLRALAGESKELLYRPIDVSGAALSLCEKQLGNIAVIDPVRADWLDGLARVARERSRQLPMLVLFLGSSIGNLERSSLPAFFDRVYAELSAGDFFLMGADLVKSVDTMIAAYDDPVGVTAAFNLNLLSRINRELHADFDLRSFTHEVRWNEAERRIEMHLLSLRHQQVRVRDIGAFQFDAGETIWTESSHKFTEGELRDYAAASGFHTMKTWTDSEWPLAETLWQRGADGILVR
jgi:L-histidine N-alpha-methyltransferase